MISEKAESYEQVNILAVEILRYARDTLSVNLRFLDLALNFFTTRSYSGTIATDGRTLYYDPYYVVYTFRKSPARMMRQFLHMMLHCVFHHLFTGPGIYRRHWDTACDLAVENVISGMNLPNLIGIPSSGQLVWLKRLEQELGVLTADKLCHWLLKEGFSDQQIADMREPFQADDHRSWYLPEKPTTNQAGLTEKDNPGRESKQKEYADRNETEKQWRAINGRLAEQLSDLIQDPGINANAWLQNLSAITRTRQSYTDFLKRFAVYGEVIHVSDEEYDDIFYTYGLKLYGNLPLIEPLEYSEVKKIRDFVVAVDTSGSVKGELVQTFMRKTYEILSQRENFFCNIHLHIIQCDAEIQEDAVITSGKELDNYISAMTLKGFGGTDFRPVFHYVDSLREQGKLKDLKGLIYFTDGKGIFPERRPDYDTAFVFLENGILPPEVPAWAIRLVLQPDEIRED